MTRSWRSAAHVVGLVARYGRNRLSYQTHALGRTRDRCSGGTLWGRPRGGPTSVVRTSAIMQRSSAPGWAPSPVWLGPYLSLAALAAECGISARRTGSDHRPFQHACGEGSGPGLCAWRGRLSALQRLSTWTSRRGEGILGNRFLGRSTYRRGMVTIYMTRPSTEDQPWHRNGAGCRGALEDAAPF